MKRILSFTLCLLFPFLVQAQFSGKGTGTERDPFQITNADELFEINGDLSACYQLMNDVDMTEWITENNPTLGWMPIGSSTSPFTGNLEGNNHSIKGLFINRPTASFVGLFGYVNGGTIKQLALINPNVTGLSSVGSVAGYITGTGYKGQSGSTQGTLSQVVVVSGRVNAIGNMVGGLVGQAVKCTVSGCYCFANVTGTSSVGGICGEEGGYIYWDGNIYNWGYRHIPMEITDNLFDGCVIGKNNVGGIVGHVNKTEGNYSEGTWHDFTCQRNIVKGIVKGDSDYIGGLTGGMNTRNTEKMDVDATVFKLSDNVIALDSIISTTSTPYRVGWWVSANNYVLSTMITKAKGRPISINDDVQNGTGFGEKTLKRQATYEGLGFNFNKLWTIQEGKSYPYGINQGEIPEIVEFVCGNKGYIKGLSSASTGVVNVLIDNSNYSSYVVDGRWEIAIGAVSKDARGFVSVTPSGKAPSPVVCATAVEKAQVEYHLGDVNGDGVVDTADVTALVNGILNKPSATFIRENADMNGDGLILIDDVVMVIETIMSKQ